MSEEIKLELTGMEAPQNFEEALQRLEQIVQQLEQGELPLEKSILAFQNGIQLSNYCQKTLTKAEQTVAKIMTENGEEPLDSEVK